MMPGLDKFIEALECELLIPDICKTCKYGYYDDSKNFPTWTCNFKLKSDEALFYLRLYRQNEKEKSLNGRI